LASAASVGGISSVSAASATAPTSFAQNYPPLQQQQLAQPIITLSQSGAGEHILQVRVAPDDLGPVTVQAHVSDSGVRIELFAPNDDSRDAIKQILPDLRKDLNQSAGGGSVDVSDRNAPGADSEGQDQHNWDTPSDGTRRGLRDDRQDATTTATTAPRPSGEHVLDVLV
jgi:flagellar hook-length control protein FliK